MRLLVCIFIRILSFQLPKKSNRVNEGELEITSVNQTYLEQGA